MNKDCDTCFHVNLIDTKEPCRTCCSVAVIRAHGLFSMWLESKPKNTINPDLGKPNQGRLLRSVILTTLQDITTQARHLEDLTYAQHADIQKDLDVLKRLFGKAGCGQC